MKLLCCLKCSDIFVMEEGHIKECKCGASSGAYVNNMDAELEGPAVAIAIDNNQFLESIKKELRLIGNDEQQDKGQRFEAWTIPHNVSSVDYDMSVLKEFSKSLKEKEQKDYLYLLDLVEFGGRGVGV